MNFFFIKISQCYYVIIEFIFLNVLISTQNFHQLYGSDYFFIKKTEQIMKIHRVNDNMK